MKRLIFNILLLCLLSPVSALGRDLTAEPIRHAGSYPLAVYRLRLVPESAKLPESGSFVISSTNTWSNTFNFEEDFYTIDAETKQSEIALVYGFNSRVSIETRISAVWQGGGILDSAIDDWHQFFGFPRGFRDRVEDDDFEISGVTRNGSFFSLAPESGGLSDLKFKLKTDLAEVFDIFDASSLSVHFSLPTSSLENKLRGPDYGLSLLGDINFLRGEIAFGAMVAYRSDLTLSGLEYNRYYRSSFVSLSYPLSQDFYLISAIVVENQLIKNVPLFPRYSLYLDLGFRARFGSIGAFDFAVRENPGASAGSSDVEFIIRKVWNLSDS